MKTTQQALAGRLLALLRDDFPVEAADFVFAVPPERKFGDLSLNLPFALARRLKEKPFAIGNRIVEKVRGHLPGVREVQIAGGGFLNFFLERDAFLRYLVGSPLCGPAGHTAKVVVEHTSINPNKAAHIGHLRNSCLGDTLVRFMRFLGHPVEVQNYIDDTGIQVADVVWGFLHHRGMSAGQVKAVPNLVAYLWDFYSEVTRVLEEDAAKAAQRNEVHRRIEEKIEPEYGVCMYVAQTVLQDHLRVMERLGIRYDLLTRESDVIAMDFFSLAAERLVAEGIMVPSQDPEKKGCQVIFYQKENIEKIIVRSNGTLTYIAKDLGYHFWKYGLLERDFHYRSFARYADGHEIFITSDAPDDTVHPTFGRAARVYNVIDVRQAYLQNLIGQVLGQLGHQAASDNFVHFAYGMVALTPRCMRELGFPLAEEDEKRPYIELSGRKGIAVRADELLDIMTARLEREVLQRNAGLEPEKAQTIAADIAVGALRYFMIKYSLNAVIAFDFKEALTFEGDTGPYLQYTVVRLKSILRRLGDEALRPDPAALELAALEEGERERYWEIVLHLSQLESQVEFALGSHEPAVFAQYVYSLCQKLNHYYHLYPILAEQDPARRRLRLLLVHLCQHRIETMLDIMGIPVPEKM